MPDKERDQGEEKGGQFGRGKQGAIGGGRQRGERLSKEGQQAGGGTQKEKNDAGHGMGKGAAAAESAHDRGDREQSRAETEDADERDEE